MSILIGRVGKDWLLWRIGTYHFGIHRYGKCWGFGFKRTEYNHTAIYSFWRFFLTVPIEAQR